MALASLNPQDVAPMRAQASLAALAESLTLKTPVADRPENSPPAPLNPERPAPGNGMADEPPAPVGEALESRAAPDAPLIDRLEMAPQMLESGPGESPQVSGVKTAARGEAPPAVPAQNPPARETPIVISVAPALEDVAADTLLPVDAPASCGPFANPAGRWPNVRATLNGVAAC
jgi:hypothetical protein